MTADLVAFLRARIADDRQRVAMILDAIPTWDLDYAADFLARWGMDRVLAECDAKERVIVLYETAMEARSVVEEMDWSGQPQARAVAEIASYQGMAASLLEAVLALALPYAGHPDFRPEWRTT